MAKRRLVPMELHRKALRRTAGRYARMLRGAIPGASVRTLNTWSYTVIGAAMPHVISAV